MNCAARLLLLVVLFVLSSERTLPFLDDYDTVPASEAGNQQKSWGMDEPGHHGLYICRAQYAAPGRQKGFHLGKWQSQFAGCHIGYGGVEYVVPEFQVVRKSVLIRQTVDAVGGQVPGNPADYLGGGVEGAEDGGKQMLVCLAEVPQRGTQLGKMRAEFRGCLYPYGGVENLAGTYKLLQK